LYFCAFSKATTLLKSSTTQIKLAFRVSSQQILHLSISVKLPHIGHGCKSFFASTNTLLASSSSSKGISRIDKAIRSALFSPTPGNLLKNSISCSNFSG